MSAIEFGLEIGLVFLLAVTLIQAIRLERALGVLRRARAGLEPLVEEFDASTRQAEAAIARLHEAADSAGRQIGRQTDSATSLKDDLAFLVERGDRLADRIDGLVRSARPLAAGPRLVVERALADLSGGDAPIPQPPARPLPQRGPQRSPRPVSLDPISSAPTLASGQVPGTRRVGAVPALVAAASQSHAVPAVSDLGNREMDPPEFGPAFGPEFGHVGSAPAAPIAQRDGQRVRSQAERDLLAALRVAR